MSSTPAASADDIAKHGWTAVAVDGNVIFNGKPYLHKPSPLLAKDIPFPSDDPIVAKVQEYVKEHLIEQTYNHSMRVYHWGKSSQAHAAFLSNYAVKFEFVVNRVPRIFHPQGPVPG